MREMGWRARERKMNEIEEVYIHVWFEEMRFMTFILGAVGNDEPSAECKHLHPVVGRSSDYRILVCLAPPDGVFEDQEICPSLPSQPQLTWSK